MFAFTSIKGIGRCFANIVCKKADVDINKRTDELSAVGLQNMMTVVASPCQFKIPDWFLNRKKDYKDYRYSQVVSNALDMKLRDNRERLKKRGAKLMFVSKYDPNSYFGNELILVYSKKRMVNEAFDACRYLGDHELDANIISFSTMLHVS
ncbi:40S ribosomal protein S18-like [Zingiber officinale]|uniref:40S ribosomal protein S18-like n=1 Tax=Zingiber officinale TaxID=94328 RepID=UPI001C4ADB8F|nr:40S ribosomal protein S18-like [Zingiber officinale]